MEPKKDREAPSPQSLIAASALLATVGHRLPAGLDPEEVATSEFAFYSAQTFLFERAGEALLDAMSAQTHDRTLLDAFHIQKVEESTHVRAYESALSILGTDEAMAFVRRIGGHEATLIRGSLVEQMVIAFVVLESIAMGIFDARRRVYAGSALARLDARVLVEEAGHQRVGAGLLAVMVSEGGTPVRDVLAIAAEGTNTVQGLLAPRHLFAHLGIETTVAERNAIESAGFLGVQRDVTRRAMSNALRTVHRASKEGTGHDRHRVAS